MARPMPRDPPVTRATRSVNSLLMDGSFRVGNRQEGSKRILSVLPRSAKGARRRVHRLSGRRTLRWQSCNDDKNNEARRVDTIFGLKIIDLAVVAGYFAIVMRS